MISKNYFIHTLHKIEKNTFSTFKNVVLIGVTWVVENKDLGTTEAFSSLHPQALWKEERERDARRSRLKGGP